MSGRVRPPVAGVVGLAVVEPAERLEGEPADRRRRGIRRAWRSGRRRPSELCIAWRARAAPGASFGRRRVEGRQAGVDGVQRHQGLDRDVRDQRVVVGRPGDERRGRLDLAQPAEADDRLEPDPGIGVGEAVDERCGRDAAPRPPCGRPGRCRANSRTFGSPVSFTSVAIDSRPSSCSSVKIAATRGASGPSARGQCLQPCRRRRACCPVAGSRAGRRGGGPGWGRRGTRRAARRSRPSGWGTAGLRRAGSVTRIT